jgi:hypothetical protein
MTTTVHNIQLPAGSARVVYEGAPQLEAGALTRFTVGVSLEFALPAGAQLGIARRWPSDWGLPQSDNPAALDYVRIHAAAGRQFHWHHGRQHAWHPFDHVLVITLVDPLPAGEQLNVAFGDASQGSPGFTVQTFIEEESPLSVRLRAAPDAGWVELARPTVPIVGTSPHRIVLTAPSRVAKGLSFDLHVRVEDVWGNPARLEAPVSFDKPLACEVHVPASGWMRVAMTLAEPGFHRLVAQVAAATIPRATSNPIEVVDDAVVEQLYWGDLHAQSVIGCGARSIDAYYAHARDFAATDFSSHQANCFLVTTPEWEETQAATARVHEDGRFVALLGVEWSAASQHGGDHNLYFPGDHAPLRRCSHEFIADTSDLDTDLPHINDLHAHYEGTDTVVALHVGGRTANLQWHAPALDRLLEIHSTHATSEWFLFDALRRGYRMGVTAGSDSVDGRPGASHPGHMAVRNLRGGLTAVPLHELSRGALWRNLKRRHCYATTGERIVLGFTAGDTQMGDEITVQQVPVFDVLVEGTAPIETIEFFRDDICLRTIDLLANATNLSNSVRVGWNGANAQGNWQRARMCWDGVLRVRGAQILAVHPWAFDTPDEGIRETSPHSVHWRSITAGDWDGVVLDFDDLRMAELSFVTEPLTLQARLSDLGTTPRTFEAVSPMRKVELRRLPTEPPALGWRGRFEDPTATPGAHAYWIRVRQTDAAQAWSTPIFVTLTAP